MSPRTLLLLAATLSAAPLWSQERPVEPRPWPFEGSDIPVNPRMHFGELDNGMRWVWMANPKPEERSYLRLHINAGSLAEGEGERGMAHFLEHMAFNGSRNFPAGTLVEWFQKHGMAFGADTNAFTSFGETIYQLDLPDSGADSLREGLQVLRDFADGLLIDEQEVEAEKGVIDGEERERDSAGYRVLVQMLRLAMDGTRVPERLPIGVQADRDAFTAAGVRAFYEKWYRPENATLILVGDLGELDPEGLIREAFRTWAAPAAPLAQEPAPGAPSFAHRFFSVFEREIPSVSIEVAMLEPDVEERLTRAEMLRRIPAQYARSMLNLRLQELAKEDGAPFLRAFASRAEGPDTLGVFQGETLRITCKPEQWREALAACEQELRRALTYGFQQAELEEARSNALRELRESVEQEATVGSPAYLQALLAAAENPAILADARTTLELLQPAIEKLTVEGCRMALAGSWRTGTLILAATGGLDLGAQAGELLEQAWEGSRKVEVEKPAEIAADAFAYASSPDDPGVVAEREHVEDLDIHRVQFENGVRLWIKKTAFKDKQVLVSAQLGAGSLTLPPERYPLVYVADQVFDRCGLEAHSEDDLRRLTAGRVAGVSVSVGTDAFVFSGSTTSEDLLLQCELMCAYLQHPGWREEGLRSFRKRVPQTYEMLRHQQAGPIMTDFIPALHGGDPRFGLPPQAAVEAVTLEQMQEWMAPHLQSDPLDVVFIGDLDVEETVAAAARSFGKLPPRSAPEDVSANLRFPGMRSGLRQEHAVDTQIQNALILVAFPTTDGRDPRTRRALTLLGEVVADRLRVEVREKLGASYSPGAAAESSTVFPELGFLMMQAVAAPDQAEPLLAECLNVAESLAEDGVTGEELERMKEPLLKHVRDQQETNGFWLAAVSDLHNRPEALEDVRSVWRDLEAISAEELSELARQYLPRERASVVIVQPQAAAADAQAKPGR
ncbi:MAG: insulinase family protein [Planctomycetota bacterium]|nr:MAG: insulinase family protein [Planctomycetota bacterium]